MSTPLTPTSEAAAVSYTSDELHDSLVRWLQSCLELGGTHEFDGTSLNDGVTISACLAQLAPATFTVEWREKIISETAGNWRLKLNNLKKINKAILDYYDTVLHLSLDSFSHPDLSLIANGSSKPHMASLLQLVLGISINCDQKETYIQNIMAMQEDSQHVIMAAIQELISTQSPRLIQGEAYKELEEQHKHTLLQLREAQTQREQLLQTNHDLTAQLRGVQEEGEELGVELERVKEELAVAKSSAGVTGTAKLQQTQRQLDSIKSDKLHLETERDELRHRLQELETQITDLLQKNRDLQVENEEIPILRDSLEEMKYMESKVKNYESVIHQYKKKLEDGQQMKKQLKAMEDKNMTYMQQNLDLEEELRRLGGLRGQIDMQKEKQLELENELAQEKLRCLEATQDAEDKHQILESLRLEVAQLKREQVPGTPTALVHVAPFHAAWNMQPPTPGALDHPDLGSALNEVLTPEMREKMARQEKEMEILKRRLAESETALEAGGGAGVGRGSAVAPGQRGSREETAIIGGAGGGAAEQTVAAIQQQLREKIQRISQLEAIAQESRSQASSLEEVRRVKDAEIEKYKKYLNKAKKIIEGFGEGKSRAAEDSLEIQNLKSHLKEKEKAIERVEREYMQDRLSWEREEKLVVSAWYEMGLMMHRKYSQERLITPHASFLSQQRSALYKKPVSINTPSPAVSALTTSTGDS